MVCLLWAVILSENSLPFWKLQHSESLNFVIYFLCFSCIQKVFCSIQYAKTTVPQTGFSSLMQIPHFPLPRYRLLPFPLPQDWLLFHLGFHFLSQFLFLCLRTSFSIVSLKSANIFPEYVIRFLSVLNLGIPLGLGI